MTHQELVDKIRLTSHRNDLAAMIPLFIEDARALLQYRLGISLLPLQYADSTNEILQENWLLYFYPSMKALYEYIVEIETAAYYDGLYQGQVDEYFVKRRNTTPLTITPEVPAP